MHNIFCLTKAEVLLPPLTQSSPSPIDVCPQAPCLKEVENLLVFLQQKTTEKMHTSRFSRRTTYGYSRCVMCVCISACGAYQCVKLGSKHRLPVVAPNLQIQKPVKILVTTAIFFALRKLSDTKLYKLH